eukprot:4598350-Pyramimonas_sp.AAC.1
METAEFSGVLRRIRRSRELRFSNLADREVPTALLGGSGWDSPFWLVSVQPVEHFRYVCLGLWAANGYSIVSSGGCAAAALAPGGPRTCGEMEGIPDIFYFI